MCWYNGPDLFYGSDPSLARGRLSHIGILCACCYLAVTAHRLTINIELLWNSKVLEVSQILKVLKFLKSQGS